MMAGCGGKKKMAYGGKVKKMQEGGMAAGNTQAEIEKLNQRIEMLRRQAEEQARAGSQGGRLGGVPGQMPALAPRRGAGGALGGMKKGGEVEMSKGVKGRTSAKAKKDQLNFQRGYAKGLSKANRQFNIKGEVDTTEDEADKAYRGKTKFYEGEVKGKSDMKEALKGQGAYKKGGKVKKGYHKMPDGKMMKDSAHKGMKKGGMVKRDGCAVRGKTKGRMV